MKLREYAEAQCTEMQKHKWIESEKAGFDLGESACLDWVKKYAKIFRDNWIKEKGSI